MSWIVFDCPSGISGDMTLGALVDLGVPLASIRDVLATLPLEGWALREERVTRNSIAATHVHVDLAKGAGPTGAKHTHAHPHPHEHPHTHAHEHEHESAHATAHDAHRHLGDVLAILEAGKLSPRALAWAVEVFRKLAVAEAKVHQVPVESVHFHEVGAVDAIIDIAGACVGLDLLCEQHDVRHIRVSQLRVGRGQVRTEHGVMAVPPPAVLELLAGIPMQWSATDGERVTPTGAAILATLATSLGDAVVRVQSTGYGAGTKEFADAPNVLRLLVVEPEPGRLVEIPEAVTLAAGVQRGRVAVLSTTIDDMVPEFFGHLMTQLLAAGALDVHYTAVQMKKSRPATLVTVIARPGDAEALANRILNESSTLGVRVAYEERFELERRLVQVPTAYGSIQVKLAVRPDGGTRAVPEYESVRQAAESAGVPIADVYQAALRAATDGSTT